MLIYNKLGGYNKARYNADGFELAASDGFSVADNTVAKNSKKSQSDLTILSYSTSKQQNKSVTDSVRMNDWTRFRKDQPDPWSD